MQPPWCSAAIKRQWFGELSKAGDGGRAFASRIGGSFVSGHRSGSVDRLCGRPSLLHSLLTPWWISRCGSWALQWLLFSSPPNWSLSRWFQYRRYFYGVFASLFVLFQRKFERDETGDVLEGFWWSLMRFLGFVYHLFCVSGLEGLKVIGDHHSAEHLTFENFEERKLVQKNWCLVTFFFKCNLI